MQFSKLPKSVSNEGFYFFMSPPKCINPPKSLLSDKEKDNNSLIIGKCNIIQHTPNFHEYATRRSSRSKRLTEAWCDKDYFQINSPNQINNNLIIEDIQSTTIENIETSQQLPQLSLLLDDAKPIIINKQLDFKDNESQTDEQLEITRQFENKETQAFAEVVDSQFTENENLEIEPMAYKLVSAAMEEAMLRVLSAEENVSFQYGIMENDSPIDEQMDVIQEDWISMITIRIMSESYVEDLVPSILNRFQETGLLEEPLQDEGPVVESFLPQMHQEFEIAAEKLDKLCHKLDMSEVGIANYRETFLSLIDNVIV